MLRSNPSTTHSYLPPPGFKARTSICKKSAMGFLRKFFRLSGRGKTKENGESGRGETKENAESGRGETKENAESGRGKTKENAESAKRSKPFDGLPSEITRQIVCFLPLSSAAALALCNHSFLQILGDRYWRRLRESCNKEEKTMLLQLLDRDLPDHLFCESCPKLHQTWKTCRIVC